MSEQDVADAFDVAVQDRMLVPREKPCKKNPPYAADTKGDYYDEDENATGRKLSKCELEQITALLQERLALKRISGPIGDEMLTEKLNVIKEQVTNGTLTVGEARSAARQWLGQPLPSCMTRVQRKEALASRCAPSRAQFGTDNRDACYDKLSAEINTITRQELYDNVAAKNKTRVTLNDVIYRYNCLLEEIPSLELERDRMKPTIQRKRDELVRLRTDLATWVEEKPRMENQLQDLICIREEKIKETAKIRAEMERIKQNMINHESALNKLKCLPQEMQECYYALERLTRDYEEARMKREELKSDYHKMFATTKHLVDTLLHLHYIPDIVRYFAEYPDNRAVCEFMTARGINTKRFQAVEAKIKHSMVLATRLKQILERFEQNERRVLKGLTY
jgi:uncharacterized coiled-coil DUF342 family protein